ncbi:MAG: NYN domain-containing protein [Omnitrophica bacterium]|nr:NYN domain-containing protein [Candidatus Omnitrophota bacterium]
MKYIIDGYNVIHQIEQLKGKRLRSQREGLIGLLEAAQAQNKRFRDLTIVFDGQSDVLAPRIHSTVKIIFTRGKSADKKIKEIVDASSFARDISVISDDREIISFISSAGAKKISVDEFLKKVYRSQNRESSFKLDQAQVCKINQELEKLWLNE